MRVSLNSYWTPKAGNQDDEYEDAFAPDSQPAPDAGAYRFAVADGATEASYSRSWAELLVHGAVDGTLDLTDPSSLSALQREWDARVAPLSLPWFAEEKARQGAYAALVVLELRDTPTRHWRASAVGDSCLFHLRAGNLQTSYPMRHAADFGISPYLIGSRCVGREVAERLEAPASDAWEPGDEFLLMSDALACWFLTETEAGRCPAESIAHLADPNNSTPFREWVESLRQSHNLRNDDTTLLRIAATQ
jgi:hypothetical protein